MYVHVTVCVHVTGDVCLSVSSCSTGVTVALQLLRSVVEIVGPHAAEEALDVVGCSTLFLYTIPTQIYIILGMCQ